MLYIAAGQFVCKDEWTFFLEEGGRGGGGGGSRVCRFEQVTVSIHALGSWALLSQVFVAVSHT